MRQLHVLNGDATRRGLERAGVGGRLLVWTDLLHEGPVPQAVGTDAVRRTRAEYLALAGYGNREAIAETMRAADEQLACWFDYDEIVFWLEHDLFDQLLLLRHLVWLARSGGARHRARLIVADRDLGPLAPDALKALLPARRPVESVDVEAGVEAWQAVTADDPTPLAALVARGPRADLPFLGGALGRLIEELPGAVDGLSRSERQLLVAVTRGHDHLERAFEAAQAMEGAVFMGDASFAVMARRLDASPDPPLRLTPAPGARGPLGWRAALTCLGRALLAGEADHVATNGVDRWVGGVRLSGRGPLWRASGTGVLWK